MNAYISRLSQPSPSCWPLWIFFSLVPLLFPGVCAAQRAYIPDVAANSIKVIDTSTDSLVTTINCTCFHGPFGVSVSPDGSQVWVANSPSPGLVSTLIVIDTATNSVARVVSLGGSYSPYGVAFTPDGQSVYVALENSCNATCPVAIVDTKSYVVNTTSIRLSGQPLGIAFTRNPQRAYITYSASNLPGDQKVAIYAGATRIGDIRVDQAPWGVTVSPDDSTIYVVNQNANTISYFPKSMTSGTAPSFSIGSGTGPRNLAVMPDGRTGYVTRNFSGGKTVVRVDLLGHTPLGGPITVGSLPDGINITPDGAKAYVTTQQGAYVISTITNSVTASVTTSPSYSFGNFIQPARHAANLAYLPAATSNDVAFYSTKARAGLGTIRGSTGSNLHGIAFSPDRTRAYVTARNSNYVEIIDTVTCAVIGTVDVGASPAGVVVSPDGNTVYVTNSGSDSLSYFATNTSAPAVNTINLASGSGPLGVAITPDGSKLYVSNFGNDTVAVVNTATKALCTPGTCSASAIYPISLGASGSGPYGIAVSPNGKSVYIAGYKSGKVYVVNAVNDLPLTGTSYPISVGGTLTGLSITPDGLFAYVANYTGGVVFAIGIPSASLLATIAVGRGPYGVSANPDNSDIYVANREAHSVSVIDRASNMVTTTLSLPASNIPQAFGQFIVPPPSVAYVPTNTTNSIPVFSTSAASNHDEQGDIATAANPQGAALSPDGALLYVTETNADSVKIVNALNNASITRIGLGAGSKPYGIAVTPDGRRAYVAGAGTNKVYVIDLVNNVLCSSHTAVCVGFTYPISVGSFPTGIAITPGINSKIYVTNQGSGTVSAINTATDTLCNTSTCSPVGSYPMLIGSSTSHPYGIAVKPDGSEVYVASYGTNNVYAFSTSADNAPLAIGVGNSTMGIAITPDGSKVYATNYNTASLSVIKTASHSACTRATCASFASYPIPTLQNNPYGLAITPDGSQLYVANQGSGTVSIINTATDAVIDTKNPGGNPQALGNFIR
jgi:YVTN family beta-propeller protein